MEACSADEAILARATELYAEGMSLEEANEPQLALDRYRRAVRMADERKILARLQAETPCPTSSCSAPPLPAPAPPPAAAGAAAQSSAEEDFQLWRAMHLSRLEAEATGGAEAEASAIRGRADGPRAVAEAPRGEVPHAAAGTPPAQPTAAAGAAGAAAAGGRFEPPPRCSGKAGAALAAEEEERETEEDAEEADRMALYTLRRRLGLGSNEATSSEDVGPEPAAAVRARLTGPGDAAAEEPGRLTSMLHEVLPGIFAFLDAYGLDRSSRVCKALRRLARSSPVWYQLAKRCLPAPACAGVAPTDGRHWRRELLTAPRLRTDGVYIAPCSYRRRIQKGSSLTDTRESMYIQYHRLLRALPEDEAGMEKPQQRILVLTFEGDLALAVEALKTHPAGRDATFGTCPKAQALGEVPGAVRKVQERAQLGSFALDREGMAVSVRYADAKNEYVMEFTLAHGRKDGSRQNCRLTWLRYDFTSLTIPQDGGSFHLHREQHYAPYAFARVRALEHLL